MMKNTEGRKEKITIELITLEFTQVITEEK